MRAACASPCVRAARRGRRALPAGASRSPAGAARAHGGHGDICGRGRRPRRPASPERPHARMDVPVRAACAFPARGAPRTSRPTSRRIPFPRRGGTGTWRPRGVCGRGRRPRRPASPERPRARVPGTSPCAHGRPRARGMNVPLRAARRGRRALPAGASRPPVGAARAHGGHGDICGRGRRPRRPASPGRPRARGMDVPVRTACASPCARRAEDVAPYQPAHPVPPPGRHGRMAATGTFVVGADVPGGPRPRDVPLRAACASPCARCAEDVAPYQSAHPVPLCRETLRPPGRCGHERTAARCAILFGLRGTDERGRVPVRGVHHGTAKRRKPKRPCV